MIQETRDLEILDAVRPKFGKPTGAFIREIWV